MCFSLAALYFFLKAPGKNTYFYYISFFLATFAVFIRTLGIILIIAMLVFLLIKKRFTYAAVLAVLFLLVFIPWQMRNAGIQKDGGYLAQLLAKNPYDLSYGRANLTDFARRISDNLFFYAFIIIPMVITPIFKSVITSIIAGSVLMLIIFTGLFTRLKKIGIIELYFIGGSAVLLIWPRIWA